MFTEKFTAEKCKTIFYYYDKAMSSPTKNLSVIFQDNKKLIIGISLLLLVLPLQV